LIVSRVKQAQTRTAGLPKYRLPGWSRTPHLVRSLNGASRSLPKREAPNLTPGESRGNISLRVRDPMVNALDQQARAHQAPAACVENRRAPEQANL
jgi:hypothetical protein